MVPHCHGFDQSAEDRFLGTSGGSSTLSVSSRSRSRRLLLVPPSASKFSSRFALRLSTLTVELYLDFGAGASEESRLSKVLLGAVLTPVRECYGEEDVAETEDNVGSNWTLPSLNLVRISRLTVVAGR
jgi:hypothetical protein